MSPGSWDGRRVFYQLAYGLHLSPFESARPVPEVVEVVEGLSRLPPGRALDLGCGTGVNAVYLARHGWEVTGIDLVGRALARARRRAAAAGVEVRLVEGDVTALDRHDIDGRFTLLVDVGCYHLLPAARREAYVLAATGVAAQGAVFLLYGIVQHVASGVGLTAGEVRQRFQGWELVAVTPVDHRGMRSRLRGSALTRVGLAAGQYEASHYKLVRSVHHE